MLATATKNKHSFGACGRRSGNRVPGRRRSYLRLLGASSRAFWHDLLQRPDQVMRFRFVLQPIMATIAALHDGREDARLGRSPYIWTLLSSPSERVGRLEEGVISTADDGQRPRAGNPSGHRGFRPSPLSARLGRIRACRWEFPRSALARSLRTARQRAHGRRGFGCAQSSSLVPHVG